MFVNALPWFRWLGSFLTLLLAFGLAACQPFPGGSNAPPIVQSMAWHMDFSGRATLQEVQAVESWTSFDGKMNWGFGAEPIWIRYTLRAAFPEEKEAWIVGVEPFFLDQLTLYDSASTRIQHGGYAGPRSNDALGSINFSFQIPPLTEERNLYLRIDTPTARLVMTDVWPLREAQVKNDNAVRLMVFLQSVSIIFSLWSTMQWGMSRERVMGVYAFKQWMATLWAFSIIGFSGVLLSDLIPLNFRLCIGYFIRIWTLASGVWFYTVLFEDYGLQRGFLRATLAAVALLIVLPFLQFFDMTRFMLLIANVMVIVCMGLMWLTLLFAQASRQKQSLPYLFLLVYFSIFATINIIPAAIRQGWLPINSILLAGNLMHVLLDGLVMFLLLQLRVYNMAQKSRELQDEKSLIAMNLDRTNQVLALEQRQRQEQSQFLHMLMHELKTPLSIVSLALGNKTNREENLAHASHAVQDMKAIIERCVQSDQIGELRLKQHRQAVNVVGLLRQQEQAVSKLKGRFDLAADPNLPRPHTDPQLLQIILTNLLINAAHYSDPLTPVTVTLKPKTQDDLSGMEMRVSNTPGLAGWPDTEQLFNKYYRANAAQRESGTGLGLFLSRELAQSLGGTLVYAPNHKYVEFVLWIPLHHA